MVVLTVSRYHGCNYCVAAHSLISDMMKIPAEVTDAIRNDETIADERLQALRVLTEQLLEHQGWLKPAQMAAFLSKGYSKQQLMEVLVGVAMKTLSNYTNHLAETELDEPFLGRAWSPS